MISGSLIIIGVLTFVTVCVYVQGPIPQNVKYHDFADGVEWFGIPNGLNVLSNVPFLIAGLYGIHVMLNAQPHTFANTKHPISYWFLFVSTCLIAVGSAYYHLWPTNETLFFDRLPMTIAFMSIIAILVTEKIHSRWGPRLLVPLVMLGVFSVSWWLFTELHPTREGDMRLYVNYVHDLLFHILDRYIIVQAAPVLLTPMMIFWYPNQFTHTEYMMATTGLYVAAKITETFDGQIYWLTAQTVSGHTLKHVIAAIGPALLAKMLQLRKPIC